MAVKPERRFEVNFIFDNDFKKDPSFRGALEDKSLGQILNAIKFSSPSKYVIDKKTVFIMTDSIKTEKI